MNTKTEKHRKRSYQVRHLIAAGAALAVLSGGMVHAQKGERINGYRAAPKSGRVNGGDHGANSGRVNGSLVHKGNGGKRFNGLLIGKKE